MTCSAHVLIKLVGGLGFKSRLESGDYGVLSQMRQAQNKVNAHLSLRGRPTQKEKPVACFQATGFLFLPRSLENQRGV